MKWDKTWWPSWSKCLRSSKSKRLRQVSSRRNSRRLRKACQPLLMRSGLKPLKSNCSSKRLISNSKPSLRNASLKRRIVLQNPQLRHLLPPHLHQAKPEIPIQVMRWPKENADTQEPQTPIIEATSIIWRTPGSRLTLRKAVLKDVITTQNATDSNSTNLTQALTTTVISGQVLATQVMAIGAQSAILRSQLSQPVHRHWATEKGAQNMIQIASDVTQVLKLVDA